MVQIGIAAYGSKPSLELEMLARNFIRTLSKRVKDATLILGGDWGLMGVVVDEALRQGLNVVLVLPEDREPTHKGVVKVKTGLSPNGRSTILVKSSDLLVVLGGGAGTIMESLMAYREGKPVIAIVGYGADSDWFFASIKRYPDRRGLAPYYIVKKCEEAVDLIVKLLNI